MVIRLAFAMATAFPPEMLLMDEWILAGDAAFMEKARVRVEGMVRHADILILASHSSSILAEWCNRLIWLENGQIKELCKFREILDIRFQPVDLRTWQTQEIPTEADVLPTSKIHVHTLPRVKQRGESPFHRQRPDGRLVYP